MSRSKLLDLFTRDFKIGLNIYKEKKNKNHNELVLRPR